MNDESEMSRIKGSDSSQAEQLYLDPNFIKQTMQMVEENADALNASVKKLENYCPLDTTKPTDNAQTFKELLREVALTTRMLYKTFSKAYYKSRNESFDCQPKQAKKTCPAADRTHACNQETIGDTLKKSQPQPPGKCKAKCKSNCKSNCKSKMGDVCIQPFTITIPFKLLVELGSRGTAKRLKCSMYKAGRHSSRKYKGEDPLHAHGKCDYYQMPSKGLDAAYRRDTAQSGDIFLSCASSEDIAPLKQPTVEQVSKASGAIGSKYSCKSRSAVKTPGFAKSICTCRLRKETFPDLTDNLLGVMLKEIDTEQFRAAYKPTEEVIIDADQKTGENLDDFTQQSRKLSKDEATASPQQISPPISNKEFQSQVDTVNLFDDTNTLESIKVTSTPEKMHSQSASLQIVDSETRKLQTYAYQKQLEDVEPVGSDRTETIRTGSLIDAIKATPGGSISKKSTERIGSIEQNLTAERLDQQRQEQDWGSIEKPSQALQEQVTLEKPDEAQPEEAVEKLPEDVTEKVAKVMTETEQIRETKLEKIFPDDFRALPANKQTDATQTDVSSFRTPHALRMAFRKKIIPTLGHLVIPNEESNVSHLTTEDRNVILQDLWKVFSLDTHPVLQEDDINAQVVEHIKCLLAYLPENLRDGVPIDFEVSDDPTVKATIDDLRYMLYAKCLPADGHYYSKQRIEEILRSLNDLLQPPSSVDTPLDQQSREALVHALKRFLAIGAKGRGVDEGIQTSVIMSASEKTSSEELAESAFIQEIQMEMEMEMEMLLEKYELMEALMEECIELDELTSEEAEPSEDYLNLKISESGVNLDDINYEPVPKRQKFDESPSVIQDVIQEELNKPPYAASRDDLVNESNDELRNFKQMHSRLDKDDLSSEEGGINASDGFRRSTAMRRRQSALPSYIPPPDFGVRRERWKPMEDYRPFNKIYEKPIRAISKTSLRKDISSLNSPMRDEQLSSETLKDTRIHSDISANRLPRIKKLSKDDLNLDNKIKSNASPSDISTHSIALRQSKITSAHPPPFDNIIAESQMMKNSPTQSLKLANRTELTDDNNKQLTEYIDNSIEDEEFDESVYIEEIEECEWSELSDNTEYIHVVNVK